uniref:sphingomyelin phosphodiesterase n=1 Tax=Hyaloperonospora arabidopsidis (strain Emoy2) TaxID=559515 RepID=M4C3K5_HYAAE
MFEAGTRQAQFVQKAFELGFGYHCGSVWPQLLDPQLIDGGLLILSRYPIVDRDQLVYSQGSGSDGICAKGVLYARIQLSPELSDSLHVFTTHTQAGDRIKEYNIRLAQLQEMYGFVARKLSKDPDVPVLITGDFNLDARHDLVHDIQTGSVWSTRCRESRVYQQLVADFERVVLEARLKAAGKISEEVSDSTSSEPLIIDLMKRCDTTKLGDELHPITNGDGHSSLVHKTDPLSLDKDGKCIDYMFFVPGTRTHAGVAASAMASTASYSHSTNSTGKGSEGHGNGDSVAIPRVRLTLEESATMVDHCAVAELEEDSEDNVLLQQPHPLPITHLSDHYGLRALFTFQRPDGQPVDSNELLSSVLQLHFPPHVFAQRPQHLWKVKLALTLFALVAAAGGVTLLTINTTLEIVFN